MKTTPWFPCDVTPVRVGVYQRKGASQTRWSYWNGRRWGVLSATAESALVWGSLESISQSLPWRGLAKDPTKGIK